jgi:hypothetical protein
MVLRVVPGEVLGLALNWRASLQHAGAEPRE